MGSVSGDATHLSYPPARRDDSVVDDYHGVQVPDPYRWLEDPSSKETEEFMDRQVELCEKVLAGCPDAENLRKEIKRLFDHPRYSAPIRRGNKYFYFHNSGMQDQSVLYMQDDLEGKAEVLFDPNTLSADGSVILTIFSISEDGNYMAYGLNENGSDWVTIHVMNTTDKQPMPDKLSWVKFSCMGWTHDGKGFFYGRFPAPRDGGDLDAGVEMNVNVNHQLCYHVVGTDQSEDIVCWKDPENPKHSFRASVTEDGKYVILGTNEVPGFDRTRFQVKQVFVPSKDGTKLPMFVMSKKDIKLDGSHPTLLHGYGGFNISITPSFSFARVVLCKNMGFIVCMANIRGGGEYGEEWHKAGALAMKQNCFDDFISCAEFLISDHYTSSTKLGIEGGSNGGLLVAASINQRPDLFQCALAGGGVMDMLRFHKFTIGHAWTTDYGCSDKEEEFHWLIKYSPLHNVRRPWDQGYGNQCQYPATMLLTADNDDRVVPLHSLKLIATLQYVLCTSVKDTPQTNPIIARIERKSGHGGATTKRLIDEAAEKYSFMAKMLGASWTE
ncbi:hypothetical protein QOZ80_7BG0589890 [Eleusine coracana subsp. coracana]|nr:hypothetical protein QOZ80_7BG0589890 [Eleusine coracana subsp. coracana]